MNRSHAAALAGLIGLTFAACSSGSDGDSGDVGSASSVSSPVASAVPTSPPSDAVAEADDAPLTSNPVVTDAPPVAEPVATEPAATAPETTLPTLPPVLPEGFTTVMVEISKEDGSTCEVCLWLADDPTERGRGLMEVTDLGTAEGMAFVWDEPTNGAFYMFQTVTPLSIAWFAPPDDTGSGAFVSSTDMEPCLSDDAGTCDRFPAGGEYQLAIEVFAGDLASIGITPGSRATVLAGTEAADCPLA